MASRPSGTSGQPEPRRAVQRSPVRLFFIVAASIMIAETAIMFLLGLLPPMQPAMKNILDGVLLTVLLFPVLYLFLFQPMRMHKAALQEAEEQAQAEAARDRSMLHSPARLFFIVAVSILAAEVAIMSLFSLLPPLPPLAENFVDGILLMVLLLPVLYLFLFRPLQGHVLALGLVEKSLREQNEELKEKTRQLQEAQEELVRKERLAMLGEVALGVGRELRNPLGAMSNAVYLLQNILPETDETAREYLDIIRKEITVSERLASDLMDAVHIRAPHIQTVDVGDLVKQTLGKCRIPPAVRIMIDIPPAISPIGVDSQQIHMVLTKLISNALDAMPQGGELEIGAREDAMAGNVAISVRDTGIGMTEEQLGHLFQPLFTTKARGIGLGLVVVKNLTQANGGSVSVESEPGKGSAFTVTLPAGRRDMPV